MATDTHIALLYNSFAGKGKSLKVAAFLQQQLLQRNILFSSYSDNWPDILDNFSDIWVIGGDGTLNYFINRYKNLNLPVFIFKGGTGNDFAWALYKNKSLEECFEIALVGELKKIDVGVCNGKLFINGVGIGFDGEIVKSLSKNTSIFKGHFTYLAAVLYKVFFYKERSFQIKYENKLIDKRAFMISVANGSRYGGGFLVAPQAVLNDEEFDFVLIPKVSLLKRLFYLPKVKKGKHTLIAKMDKVNKIVIECKCNVAAHLDGELMEASRFEIELSSCHSFFFRC